MFRKITAVLMAVSFVAMATSGTMMFFVNETSFTLQMHPVHKLFGLIMVIAAIWHISLNAKVLTNHLKTKSVALIGSAAVALLVMLYGVSLNHPVPESIAVELNAMAKEAERAVEGE